MFYFRVRRFYLRSIYELRVHSIRVGFDFSIWNSEIRLAWFGWILIVRIFWYVVEFLKVEAGVKRFPCSTGGDSVGVVRVRLREVVKCLANGDFSRTDSGGTRWVPAGEHGREGTWKINNYKMSCLF
jgi:hypothetical protein